MNVLIKDLSPSQIPKMCPQRTFKVSSTVTLVSKYPAFNVEKSNLSTATVATFKAKQKLNII